MSHTTPTDAINALLPGVSPAAVMKAMEDPSVLSETARGDLYILMGKMRLIMANSNTPLNAHIEWSKVLARLSRIEREETGTPLDRLPQINIIFPNSGRTTTIQAKADNVIDITPDE